MNASEPSPTSPTHALQKPLFYGAIVFAAISGYQASQDAVEGFIFLGVAALISFAISQVLAKRHLVAGLGASLVGAAIGAYLSFFVEKAEEQCGTSGWSDCGAVLESTWASIYGIPTALLACAFFSGLSVVLIQAMRSKRVEAANTLLLLAGVSASLFSLFLAYQSKVVLGEWCLFCISLYAVSFTLLGVAISGARSAQPTGLKDALIGTGGPLTGSGLVAAVLVIAVGPTGDDAHADHNHGPSSMAEIAEAPSGLDELYEEISASLTLSGREPSKGSVQAEWVVVEFTDYGCGHCADEAPVIQEVVKRHPKMKLLHKHYAFIGDGSRLAARAAVCAHEQGLFWELNSALFDNIKRDWDAEDLTFLAKARTQLSMEAFESCLADESRQESVEADYAVGERVGVRGTPAFYLSFDGSTWLKINGGGDAVDLVLSAAEQGYDLPGLTNNDDGAPE